MQAQSAKLIGDALQQNPAFLTLRKIEVRGACLTRSLLQPTWAHKQCVHCQAARDVADTISGAQNRVFLSSDSLLLNLVRVVSLKCWMYAAAFGSCTLLRAGRPGHQWQQETKAVKLCGGAVCVCAVGVVCGWSDTYA